MRTDWTPARITILINLWAEGKTGTQIASILGDVTRSGVIGKAHRLGLAPRVDKHRVVHKTKAKAPDRPPAKAPVVRLRPKPVVRLAPRLGPVSSCRWPEGDPKHPDFHFCEARTEPGRPYCLAHRMRAYVQPENEQTRRLAAE